MWCSVGVVVVAVVDDDVDFVVLLGVDKYVENDDNAYDVNDEEDDDN